MKKVGTVPTGKSGTAGHIGKSTLKLGSSLPSAGKLPTVPSASSKSYGSSTYQTPRNNKSSTFGLIWLPGKKRNKHKELSYNSHKNERTRDRAPSMYNFMSGDSSSQHLKMKEEDSDVFGPQNSGHIPVAVAGAGVVAASELPPDIVSTNSEEKQEFIKSDKDESKDAAGDANENEKKSDDDFLENNDKISSNTKSEKDKLCDNVDSVFLRSPPPHKTRAAASTAEEEEDCGIKCLYYTLQCCDCVLM